MLRPRELVSIPVFSPTDTILLWLFAFLLPVLMYLSKWTDILITLENTINNTFNFVNFHLIKMHLKENTVEKFVGIFHCSVATQGMMLKSIFTTFSSIIMASSMV